MPCYQLVAKDFASLYAHSGYPDDIFGTNMEVNFFRSDVVLDVRTLGR